MRPRKYYISSERGDDNNPGTFQKPWYSLDKFTERRRTKEEVAIVLPSHPGKKIAPLPKETPMTAATDLTAQIDHYNRVLAEATKECEKGSPQCRPGNSEIYTHWPDCECKGSGRVARFKGFRQVCYPCQGIGFTHWDADGCKAACLKCNGLGWQVRAGDSADALAGLTRAQAWRFFVNIPSAFEIWDAPVTQRAGPMPSAPEIRAQQLGLVCKVAELEVSDGLE